MNPDSKRDYYVARFGLWRVGPLSFDDVAHEIKLGSLDKRSRIYSSHLEDWTRIQEVPEFSVFLQDLPPSLFLRSSMKLSHAAKDFLSFFSPQWKSWTVFVFLTFSIAFIPFDIPIHPDWYNDTVYFIKNPDSRGFWPFDTNFHQQNATRGYVRFFHTNTHSSFNGIFAGFDFLEFVLTIAIAGAIHIFIQTGKFRRQPTKKHRSKSLFTSDDRDSFNVLVNKKHVYKDVQDFHRDDYIYLFASAINNPAGPTWDAFYTTSADARLQSPLICDNYHMTGDQTSLVGTVHWTHDRKGIRALEFGADFLISFPSFFIHNSIISSELFSALVNSYFHSADERNNMCRKLAKNWRVERDNRGQTIIWKNNRSKESSEPDYESATTTNGRQDFGFNELISLVKAQGFVHSELLVFLELQERARHNFERTKLQFPGLTLPSGSAKELFFSMMSSFNDSEVNVFESAFNTFHKN